MVKKEASSIRIDSEIAKLQSDLSSLKKKGTAKKQLSEYNLFVRRQLKSGRTFSQAVKLWKRQLKVTKQLKKKGSAKRKSAVKKPVVKKLVGKTSKPKIKKRSVPKKTRVKTVDSSKRLEEIAAMISQSQMHSGAETAKSIGSLVEEFKKSGSFEKITASEEEIALELAALYFREIARLGFKRSLEIDDVINSYFYALGRVKRNDVESKEIMGIIRRAKKVV